MRFLSYLFLVIISGVCAAQTPENDYLINNEGDTLQGHIAFYFTALDNQGKAILPQQIHYRKGRVARVVTSQDLSAFEYDYKWGVAEKAKRVRFLSNPQFRDQHYFYELVWSSDTVQLVRTYEMGAPPRRSQAFQFFHTYYFIQPTGQILEEVSPENVRKLCQYYLKSETTFLAALQKKRKVLVYSPFAGLSKLIDKSL